MTDAEILEKLRKLGIVDCIGGDWMITEKYKELLQKSFVQLDPVALPTRDLNYKTLLNTSTNGSEWPFEIKDSTGFTRATAFCDLCNIPRFAPKGYPLRGMTKESINILGNFIDDSDICPSTFIEAVTLYYKYSEMPKGIKNLFLEGTVLEIYKEHIEGDLKKSLTGEHNQAGNSTWQN
jgi:hypothetical protein